MVEGRPWEEPRDDGATGDQEEKHWEGARSGQAGMPVLGDTGYQLDTCWDEAGMRTEMGAGDHREGNEHTEALGCSAPSWGRCLGSPRRYGLDGGSSHWGRL